ncbi:hypothetical protein THASP1DRAFT_30448 [Thamnocephalis sphaerospora]|uniref:Uncharacterized protein n=1 Tax=Thamnocephalis sphaerospora TaxID=78915 RepID=A0A4P9XPE2_9FUNG|nr:hypothetical protein THASP1DRAFT_30448 [Thamnocephalis sphaerospora]|eukprot:RKP07742.1 hypothetical protein THASP1DRAFT_30448 [Thamnocephalis sphaerospora]
MPRKFISTAPAKRLTGSIQAAIADLEQDAGMFFRSERLLNWSRQRRASIDAQRANQPESPAPLLGEAAAEAHNVTANGQDSLPRLPLSPSAIDGGSGMHHSRSAASMEDIILPDVDTMDAKVPGPLPFAPVEAIHGTVAPRPAHAGEFTVDGLEINYSHPSQLSNYGAGDRLETLREETDDQTEEAQSLTADVAANGERYYTPPGSLPVTPANVSSLARMS